MSPARRHNARLARLLRHARNARGLTQQHIADVLRVSRTTVVAVEQGNRTLSLFDAAELHRATGIDLSDLCCTD